MKNINFVITSDPQYPWTELTDNNASESDEDQQARSQQLITWQYNSINEYAASSNNKTVVLINGDITAFGHGWQREKMNELLGRLTSPYRYGLGNHDIENNYHDTYNNGAATDTMRGFYDYFVSLSLSHKSWDVSLTESKDTRIFNYTGSFNYSWDEGDFHFIQMNNFPGMTGYDFNKTIHSTDDRMLFMRWDEDLTWLKRVINAAISRNKYIIVNIHKPDTWPATALSSMRDFFANYKNNIKAIFCGHYHMQHGYRGDYTKYMGGHIPVFLSGSASQQTYLIMETDVVGLVLNIYLVKNNDWRNKSLIYQIPLKDSIRDVVIQPELNVGKNMTANSNSSVILQGSYEFPEQLFSITRSTVNANAYEIKRSDIGDNLLWDESKNPNLLFAATPGGNNTLWNIEPNPLTKNSVMASYVNNEKAIDVPESAAVNGAKLIVYPRHNYVNQRFFISESRLGEPVYIVSSLNSSKVISSRSENNDVIIYQKDNGPWQVFSFIRCDEKGSNVFQIENVYTGLILAWNAVTSKQVFFHRNEYKDEHYWVLEESGDGYIFANYKDRNLVLDVSDAKTDNGTVLQIIPRNGNKAQNFSMITHPTPPVVPVRYALSTSVYSSFVADDDILHDYFIQAELNSGLMATTYQRDEMKFTLVRARAKGFSVYQIRSNVSPTAVLSAQNDGVYLIENEFENSQFWHLHYYSGYRYIISSFSSPEKIWTLSFPSSDFSSGVIKLITRPGELDLMRNDLFTVYPRQII